MYDPMDPPAQGIPADPLPDDLPEGDSGEVTDEDVSEPVFDPYGGGYESSDLDGTLPDILPELELMSDPEDDDDSPA